MHRNQHHGHGLDSTKKAPPIHLELSQQSIGRPRSADPTRAPRPALCSSPDPSRGHRKKRVKSVHWDPSVVDNEHKMKSRDQSVVPVEHSSKPPIKPSQQPILPKQTTSNMSIKNISSVSRKQLDSKIIPTRGPMSPTPLQHARAQVHRPAQTATEANSACRRVASPSSKPAMKIRKVPAAVPDPPRSYHPPPAPRPTRLSTPDLPEIQESKFFVPKDKLFDYSRGRSDTRVKPVYLKADTQLDAAMAYIQDRKRRGY